MLLGAPTIRDGDDAARAFEALLLRQMLQSSGAFRPAGAGAGASLHTDLFVDALAQALAEAGGMGLAPDLNEKPARPPAPEPVVLLDGAGVLTSGFGARRDPIHGGAGDHRGIDLAAAPGTPVLAAAGGVVRRAGERGGYGLAVEIDHGAGLTTLYAHASELLVVEGAVVERGQAIARVGETGRATGAHLHFEVREGDRPVDPARALKAYGIRADSDARGEE
ncbi:M23 family metallopeptidase [Vulgatibacter sp.]|uniref:M23 family metallopeptidase n=1 Tax=Vulgatibacter sp. TaxID=1971226 RepID=UPI00356274F9